MARKEIRGEFYRKHGCAQYQTAEPKIGESGTRRYRNLIWDKERRQQSRLAEFPRAAKELTSETYITCPIAENEIYQSTPYKTENLPS